jgi:type VI secretion system protein ImpL
VELAKDDPFPSDNDVAAVRRARQYLSQFESADRVYALLLAEAAKHSPTLSFNRQFAGSDRVLSEAYDVPGPFSKAGWDFVKDAIAHPESHFAAESWVADESQAAVASSQVVGYIAGRYRVDFARAWRQYLRSGTSRSPR